MSVQPDTPDAQCTMLPPGWRIYAVGDIHGRLDLLLQTIARIEEDRARYPCASPLYLFIGDYIDRGPDSRGVIELLMKLSRIRPIVCLLGNHEFYALTYLTAPQTFDAWYEAGGKETLYSYGVITPAARARERKSLDPDAFHAALGLHAKFLRTLPATFSIGDYFFVHAGVRPNVPLGGQSVDDLLTIREPFLSFSGTFGKIIVHGHTPVAEPEVRANRINIDTGAYATSRLTCLVLESNEYRLL